MKILFINEYYPPHVGGVEVVVQNLAQGLVKLGHEVDVVTCRLPGTAAHEESAGVNIHRVWVPKKGDRYWFNFLCLPTAWKLAKRCDIVHAGCYNSAFPPWLVATILRKKKVITVHGPLISSWYLLGMNYFFAKLYQILEKILISLPFDKHVGVSRFVRNSLRLMGTKDEKLTFIYNGIDYDMFDPEKSRDPKLKEQLGLKDKFVYLSYGRPSVLKGFEYLIQAVPLISRRIANSRLVLILSYEPRDDHDNIKRLIKALDLQNDILLLEPVSADKMPDYLAVADCVVIPTLYESFCFTAAEACAMGKPVVATDVGSLPEVVSGKYVLVEPRNPQAIAEAVGMIYRNQVKDTDKKIFSWEESVRKYLEVYKSILGS